MKISRLLPVALFVVSLFVFSACEEEQIVVKKTDGEEQTDTPVDID